MSQLEIFGLERLPLDTRKIERWATFSPCRRFRYTLGRSWRSGSSNELLVFSGLNPSDADDERDDPTVRRWIGFAYRERYDGFIAVNAFPFVASDQGCLVQAIRSGMMRDQILENLRVVKAQCRDRDVVVCWGHPRRGAGHGPSFVLPSIIDVAASVRCFGRTKHGHPKHPARIRNDTPLEPYQ